MSPDPVEQAVIGVLRDMSRIDRTVTPTQFEQLPEHRQAHWLGVARELIGVIDNARSVETR